MDRERFEKTARSIFGDDSEAVARWVDYWAESASRNRSLLESFRPLALIDFTGKRVLDVGCGTGGMAEVLRDSGARYVGMDYHRHVLELAPRCSGRDYVQASGVDLPFGEEGFDYVTAFDVIEHLVGGYPWQVQFLRELRRVLRPLGMILLTTPNRWYPYEAHSGLYGPQYLPLKLANRYVASRNPAFLREHKSFSEIRLLTPSRLRRALKTAGLSWLHDLPCGLDRAEYVRLHPIRGLLAYLGLGWYPHAEFWGVLVRSENRERLRLKRPGAWFYVQNQPDAGPLPEFQPRIDFGLRGFGHQLGEGWYWHERDRRGFRWTSREAHAYLQTAEERPFVEVDGFSPEENALEVQVEGRRVGQRKLPRGQPFQLRYLVPLESTRDRILKVTLRSAESIQPQDPSDQRDLGVMIFSLRLAA